jgi:eukaryotic-like serine/threonine-protein kinase
MEPTRNQKPETSAMTGTQIGNYKILEKLGEGGMGVVYKAVDINLDRTVAIKALNTELTGNPELETRFRAEAKAQANLNHTNLATLYALLIEEGRPWMVMEFIEGETFEQMVQRRGPIPGNDAVPLFRQALLGIGYAHRMGVVHRDIKPSNIMLNKQGIVKVMDFGIAKVMGTRGMTKTGTQMGTAFYMSPEQVLNRGADIRSDIYSLGVTLYEMLTANVPFNGDSDYQVMTDHVNAPPPLPTKFYPYIPQGLQNAVLKALEKKPDARFQTVEEFGTALEQPDTFNVTPAQTAPPLPPPVQAAPLQAAPAPRAATVVETAASAATVRVESAVTAVRATIPDIPAAGPPPPDSAKASFWTPERKIAGGGLAAILVLIGIWAALRPNVKNTGLPSAGTSAVQTPRPEEQSPAPSPMAPTQSPQNPAPQNKTPQKKTAQNNSPADNGIPALPPVQTEPTAPNKRAPAQSFAIRVPAGTMITVRLIDAIDTRRDRTGQRFAASVDLPVVIGGHTMIPRGAGARVVLTNFGSQAQLELVSISANGANHILRSNIFQQQGMIRGKPSPFVIMPPDTRILFTLKTPIT